MAIDHHFLISGNTPFSQDGIFEVELAISESKPSDTEIKTKSFSSIWKQNFHLKVKNGRFQETIGSHENPLPDSISSRTRLYKASSFGLGALLTNFWLKTFLIPMFEYIDWFEL